MAAMVDAQGFVVRAGWRGSKKCMLRMCEILGISPPAEQWLRKRVVSLVIGADDRVTLDTLARADEFWSECER